MIITVIVYTFTSDIEVGKIISEVDVSVMKLGRFPVASFTEEIVVVSPTSGSVILGNRYVVDYIRGAV